MGVGGVRRRGAWCIDCVRACEAGEGGRRGSRSPSRAAAPTRWQGYGTFESPDGARYQGSWERNLKHGIGRKVYANSDAYEGLWQYGRAEGPGR